MSLKKTICILGVITMMSAYGGAEAQNLVPKEIVSPTTGKVTYTIPLPSDWHVSNNPNSQYFISSPDGVKMSHAFDNEYFYGQRMGGFAQSSGRQFLAPMAADQYFQQVVKPSLESQGFQFLGSYALPEYVDFMQKGSAMMSRTRNQRTFQAIGSDWKTGPGEKSMVTTVLTYVQGSGGTAWTAQLTQTEAPNSKFEWAKKTVRWGVANSEIGRANMQRMNEKLDAFNRDNDRKSKERMAQSQREHDIRMRGIADMGEISRAGSRDSMDALDSSMSSWQKIQAIRDGGQSDSVRAIHEETIITDPNTGYSYEGAPAGHGYYWVTPDGELMTSEDPNFNPNTDRDYNDYDWTQYQPE